jgi:hypothetical protein
MKKNSVTRYLVCLYARTKEANRLKHFFDFGHKTHMKNGLGKLNMSKVSRTIRHAPSTSGAFEITVIGTKTHIKQAANFWQ